MNRFLRKPSRLTCLMMALACGALFSGQASATPSQAEVFKSISDNVNQKTDSSGLLLWMSLGGGVLILLAILSQRQRRAAVPKPLLHHGKLLKEICRTVPLRRAEIKQLSSLAEVTAQPNGRVLTSPLTLLLCPSVLGRGINNKSLQLDRRALAGVYKKLTKASRPTPVASTAKK